MGLKGTKTFNEVTSLKRTVLISTWTAKVPVLLPGLPPLGHVSTSRRCFGQKSAVACDVTPGSDKVFGRGSTNTEPGAVATGRTLYWAGRDPLFTPFGVYIESMTR